MDASLSWPWSKDGISGYRTSIRATLYHADEPARKPASGLIYENCDGAVQRGPLFSVNSVGVTELGSPPYFLLKWGGIFSIIRP
jgi:hypothetical protein